MKRVWVNGCFDLIHEGHIKLLEYAALQGDFLIVGIDSDDRVKQLKGNDRPIYSEVSRRNILDAIRFVNSTVIFDSEEELENLIKDHKIDIMVVGSEYENKRVVGSEYAGEVRYFPKYLNKSTTSTIEKILNKK